MFGRNRPILRGRKVRDFQEGGASRAALKGGPVFLAFFIVKDLDQREGGVGEDCQGGLSSLALPPQPYPLFHKERTQGAAGW